MFALSGRRPNTCPPSHLSLSVVLLEHSPYVRVHGEIPEFKKGRSYWVGTLQSVEQAGPVFLPKLPISEAQRRFEFLIQTSSEDVRVAVIEVGQNSAAIIDLRQDYKLPLSYLKDAEILGSKPNSKS